MVCANCGSRAVTGIDWKAKYYCDSCAPDCATFPMVDFDIRRKNFKDPTKDPKFQPMPHN